MQMRRNRDCRSDDNQVFDYVLPFERGDERCGPRIFLEEKKWHDRRRHVDEK